MMDDKKHKGIPLFTNYNIQMVVNLNIDLRLLKLQNLENIVLIQSEN
jgi:hypothetical protein